MHTHSDMKFTISMFNLNITERSLINVKQNEILTLQVLLQKLKTTKKILKQKYFSFQY